MAAISRAAWPLLTDGDDGNGSGEAPLERAETAGGLRQDALLALPLAGHPDEQKANRRPSYHLRGLVPEAQNNHITN